jgi:hypothetical protein
LTAPFENVLFKPDIGEQGAQALSERFSFLRLVPNGIAQYFAYFRFGAPTVLPRTFLELRLYVIVEVSNHQLSHDLPFIMIS